MLCAMTPAQLKRIRAALRLTQSALAEKVGVTQNTVARWEIGARGIPEPAARLIQTIKLETSRKAKRGR